MLYQILNGVAYMHQKGYVHRDLKPSNILIDPEHGLIKIADLGLGRQYYYPKQEQTYEVGSLAYKSPEIIMGIAHYP